MFAHSKSKPGGEMTDWQKNSLYLFEFYFI